MNAQTALEDPYEYSKYREEGRSLLSRMRETCHELDLTDEYIKALDEAVRFTRPSGRYPVGKDNR
ncbi:MAG: hypothetical protein U5K84_00220 [Alkalibacterium sp.]|nr:hypothetical protein [Alkalibacterium sp.]